MLLPQCCARGAQSGTDDDLNNATAGYQDRGDILRHRLDPQQSARCPPTRRIALPSRARGMVPIHAVFIDRLYRIVPKPSLLGPANGRVERIEKGRITAIPPELHSRDSNVMMRTKAEHKCDSSFKTFPDHESTCNGCRRIHWHARGSGVARTRRRSGRRGQSQCLL